MRIIAIMGSPRGQSSGYRIVRMIEDRMKSTEDVEFSYLFLKEANLKPCIGCYNCMAKRGEMGPGGVPWPVLKKDEQ